MLYSKRLAGPGYAPNSIGVIGTVPANRRWVIMFIWVRILGATSRSPAFWLGTSGSLDTLLYQFLSLPGGGSAEVIEPRIVLEAGEVLAMNSGAANDIVYGVYGYELDA